MEFSQQNATAAGNVNATAQDLAQQSGKLDTLVGRFTYIDQDLVDQNLGKY